MKKNLVTLRRLRCWLASVLLQGLNYEILWVSKFDKALNILLRKGEFYFVQIGANDGVRFDTLYEKITRYDIAGIVIEPLPRYFKRLKINYEDYPKVKALNVAIHPELKKIVLHYIDVTKSGALPPWSAGIGSLDPNHLDCLQKKYKLDPVLWESCIVKAEVNCLTVIELIEEHEITRIDLLQIDTEGMDKVVLEAFPFHRLMPRLIKFERVHLSGEDWAFAVTLLNENGYEVHAEGEDAVARLKEYFKI